MEPQGMGTRANSAGVEFGRVASMAQEIEYELANADDELNEEEGRVVMMYDDEGKATAMRMGSFYYDSVKPEDVEASKNVPQPLESFEEEEEEEEEEGVDDPFENQFMRISIPAQRLKDVSRVKKDLDHDKPQRKASIMAGLQRAVSSVRIGEGRTSGAIKETPVERESSVAGEDRAGLQRQRSSAAMRPRRQSLAAVGRMMSMSKQKKPAEGAEASAAGQASTGGGAAGAVGAGKRASLAQVGRMMSINRKKEGAEAKEKTSESSSRSLETESVVSERSMDRERRDARPEKPATGQMRMSLSKMGRLMSLSRTKKPATSAAAPPQESKEDAASLQKAAQLSPLSTSTVSSKTGESVSEDRQSMDGDRQRPSTASNTRKEATRISLKAAGRLLSFSRKPAGGGGDDGRKSRTLLVAEGAAGSSSSAPDVKERTKRAQSVPGRGGNEESGSKSDEPGQKLDGRATKFFYAEISSDRVRMSGLLGSDTHIRVPAIALAEYSGPVSRTKWYIDGFTLPHNAVRRECLDLYEILTAMVRFRGDCDITRDDMNDFQDWWKVATRFITCYFEMERTVLFPWVDAAGTKDWEVQMALKKMRSMKDKLQDYQGRIDRAWAEKESKDPGEVYALVYRGVDEFVPRLMNYFADQEVLLPAIVKGYYTLEDRLKMDKDMVNVFIGGVLTKRNREEAHHNLILLIRWMNNPRQLRAWVGKNLNSVARSMYASWYDMYQEQHYRFVKTLRNRSKALLVDSS